MGFSNAWHPSTNPYGQEWWYFTLLCNDKSAISGCFALKGTFTNLRGELWLSLYHPDREPKEIVKNCGKWAFADQGRMEVTLDDNSFYEKNGEYHLHIAEEGICLNFTGKPLFGWENNTVRHTLKQGSIDWIIPVLRGEFRGTLMQEKEKNEIAGIFFHDHVRVDIHPSLEAAMNYRGWHWGLSYGNETLLYVHGNHRKNPFNFVAEEKNGIVKVHRNAEISVAPDNAKVRVSYSGKTHIATFDFVHRVHKGKGIKGIIDKLVGSEKYHAHNPEEKHYMERLRFWR